jgi:aminopeptidase YwaD
VSAEGLPNRVIRELSVGIGPRLAGSESSHRARDVIAEILSELGLDVRLQRFVYIGWEYEAAPTIELRSPVEEQLVCAPAAYTQASDGPIEGRVWADGEITVIPDLFVFGRLAVGTDGERRAVILIPPADGPPYPIPLWGRTVSEPTVYVSRAAGERIRGLLEQGEVTVRLETHGHHVPDAVDWNVIGKLPGESEETIVVSSHYDTAIDCPGAMDNASGVGAMAEIARRVRERGARHTFEFIAFATEEFGLVGSEHFAEELARSGALARYRGVLNFDPLGPGETLEVWVGPEFLRGKVDRILAELGIHDRHPVVYREPKWGSDHYPFWLRGVPVCFPIFMPPPHHYHLPNDTVGLVEETKLGTIIDIVDAVAQELDRRPGL